MRKPIWEKIPGLERETVKALIVYNKKNNLAFAEAEARFAEILAEEAAGTAPVWRKEAKPEPVMAKSVTPVIVVAAKPIAL